MQVRYPPQSPLQTKTHRLKTISFNLPGPGPWKITINSTLFITAPVVVDGTSQAGFDGSFNRIYVEGASGVSSIFLLTSHAGTTIKGIGLYNYDNNGVTIWKDASWNFIDDDYIVFKKTANGIVFNSLRAPSCAGVGIQGNYNKVRRTTISGVYNGINVGEAIEKPTTGLVSHHNLFERNRIGTDPTGQTTVGYGNTSTGIFLGGTNVIAGSTDNIGILIGNDAKNNGAWGNVIAGNRYAGLVVASGDGNWIWNNTIGLDNAQAQALGGQPSGHRP